jgi:cell division protein FtsL
MYRPNAQKGMTAIGWLLVLAIAAVFALVVIKLIPVYLDGYKIASSMDSLAADASAQGKGPGELKKMLLKRLDINMIYDIKAEDISVTRDQGGYSVEIDYEPRIPMFGNLYVVVVFDKSVVVPAN